MLVVLDARQHGAVPRVNLLGILQMGLEAVSDPAIALKIERATFEREADIVQYLRWAEAHPDLSEGCAHE
jgi:hypothetical protein